MTYQMSRIRRTLVLVGLVLVAGAVVYHQRSRHAHTQLDPDNTDRGIVSDSKVTQETALPFASVPPVVVTVAAAASSGTDALERFDEWVGRYRAAGKPGHGQLLGEGVALAKERREAFRNLIRTNPKEAVERAMPLDALAEMPEAVGMYLERHVSGSASSSMFSPGGIEHYTDNYRELMLRGETFNSYVYGNRAEQLLFGSDDIHGVAVGADMAVEDAAQIPADLLANEDLPGKVTEGLVTATVEFSEANLLFSRENGYDIVSLKDGLMRDDKPGGPWLPTRSATVLLPAGALVQSVTATAGGESLLRSDVNLLPMQSPIPMLEGVTSEFVEPDPEAYASTRKFPASLVDGNAAGRQKGWTTAAVLVNPVRYIPATRELYLAKRVEITVRYELPPVPPVVFVGQKSVEEKDATHRVVNPAQAGASPYYVGRGDWSAKDWLSGEDAAAAMPLDGEAEPFAGEKIGLSSATYAINEAGGALRVTVTISKTPVATATVDFATANGSAEAGADYTATNGTLTWAAGDGSSKTFEVPINNDLLLEGAETFTVTLSNVTGGPSLDAATATVTINDDDTPGTFQFSQSSYDVMENMATVSLTVERVNGASGAVSVNYATVNGTAMAGQDYTADSGTLSFANGETSKDVSFTINNDTNYEGAVESFNVVLSSPTGGAELGSPDTAAVNISEDDPMPGAVDYVIITSASLAGSCGALKTYRESFNGFKVEIRDTTWINANYSGAKPVGGSDTQTAIQNFIKDYVATRGLQYVCIIGDNAVVDDRNCYASASDQTVYDMPTDLYWAGLDSSWDEDSDGTYGEYSEGDLNYDVIVGRIPVRTASQLSAYVNKMIKYETNPPQDLLGKFLLSGTKGWNTYAGDSRPGDLLNDGHLQFREHTYVDDTEIWVRRQYRDFVQANGWNADAIGCLFGTLQTPGISIFQGWNFMDHIAHGTYTSTSYLNTGSAGSMTSLIAFLHTAACQTAGFDRAEPCLSEAALRNPNGGCIVYLGCSRYGWGSPGSYYGNYSSTYQTRWMQAMFRDNQIISGHAFHEMKLSLAASSYSSYYRWLQFGINHQGDPAVMIHGIKPMVSVKVVEALAAEPGTDTASICFERTGSVADSLSVSYARSGSASAPGDFSTSPATSANGSITIPSGTNRVVVTLTAVDDSAVENDENIAFSIATSADYVINSVYGMAMMTILDNDNAVTPVVALAVVDASAGEQDSDPGTLRISRSGSVSTAISVNYTLSGTASAIDYSETLSGSVTLAAGIASVDIPVTPIDDILPESDETLDVTLTSGTGYTLGAAVDGTITILDNEPRPAVTISAVDDTAAENTADTAILRFTREGNTGLPLTVDYSLSGTASTADLSPALAGNVTIPAGTNSVDIVLTAVDDSEHELWETLVVDVVPGAGYYSVGSPSQVAISIWDDDNTAPTASAGPTQVALLVLGDAQFPVYGAQIYLDAGLDNGADATWEDSQNTWNLSINTGVSFVPDAGSRLPGITSAYDFPGGTAGDGGCDGTSLQDMIADTDPITLELWFKPDASAGYPANGQVLWETGGTGGLGIFYRNGFVEVAHDVKEGQISADVSMLTNEFIQVVVTYDTYSSTNNFKLYINGLLKATGSRSDTDMCGGDGSGLGNRGGSNTGGAGSGDASTESFNGKIAIFRAYHGRVLDAAEVNRNYSSVAAYGSADVTLAGTADDLDGDLLDTTWSLVNGPTAVSFSDAVTNAIATFVLAGDYTLRLTADDGAYQASDDVVITVKSPPITDAGPDQGVPDADDDGSESFTLNGAGSFDPDGAIVSYLWREGTNVLATVVSPTVSLSTGTHTITLEVTDNEGYTGQDTVVVRCNGAPPVVNAGADRTVAISTNLPWSPAELNPAAWYDAADTNTISASGGAVSQWSDKSGNGNHVTQATSTAQPTTGTRTLNGLNMFDFDGSDDELLDPTFPSLSSLNLSVFAVQQHDRIDVQLMTAWGLGRNTSTEGLFFHSSYDSVFNLGCRYPENTSVSYAENTNAELLSYVKTGANSQQAWVNGLSKGVNSGTVTTFTTERLALGSRFSESYLDGGIGEFVVIPSAVPEEDRQKLEGYLAHKWGLVGSLPTEHSYKIFAPGATGASVVLADASATDADGDTLSNTWTVVSTPTGGTAVFDDPNLLHPTITLNTVGEYVLRLTADDGIETDFDEMTITVIDPATVPSYSVTYNANGADSGTAPAPQVKTHGVDLTLESNSGGLTKAFYSFGGWNTAASGDGAAYPAGGTYSGNADVTLYAKWNLAVSTIPFVEDFEALAAGDLDGQNRWTASSTTVQSNRVYEGTQAATISGEGMMQQDILPVQTNVWTDFRTQPEFLDGAPTELPADATAVLYFNTSGHPVVYNGATPTTVDAITVATGQWVRVRIHSDYVAKTWDLHIDDTLAAEDLNFYTTTLSAYSSFLVKGGGMTGTALDALAITLFEAPDTETTTTNGTPYTWLDSFGITNDYELADLGDPDGDGALTWEEYLAGTDPTNAMSVFRLTSATIGVGGELELVWYGTTNSGVTTAFVVYRCTNLLSGGWEPVSTNTRSATGTNTWSGSGASGAAFYRIGM